MDSYRVWRYLMDTMLYSIESKGFKFHKCQSCHKRKYTILYLSNRSCMTCIRGYGLKIRIPPYDPSKDPSP